MGPLLMGIDFGTASSKGVLTTTAGAVVASTARPHETIRDRPGWAEVDAEATWRDELFSIARELVGAAGDAPIAGVCVSGVGPCLLLCDDRMRPVRNAILYGVDTRATSQIEALHRRYGADAIAGRCGSPLSTQAVGPKLLWVRENEPDVWRRARRWLNSNTYAVALLTGEYVMDHHTASQSDPLYDLAANAWCEDWAPDLARHLEMPRLAWPADVVGVVTAEAAELTGLTPGTPVAAGTIDAWAEALSVGVREPGDTMLMYGSTMFMTRVIPDCVSHPALWTTVGVDPGSYTLAAGTASGGSVTTWAQALFGDVVFEDLIAEATLTPPGSGGLLLLPYFAGERTPVFDPDARGVIAGLTLRHQRGHVFRAAYEGIAYGVRQILELLDGPTDSAGDITAVGGGTQSALWAQIVSDVTARPQLIPEITIGACYGDALLAAMGTDLAPGDTTWARPRTRVEPDTDAAVLYQPLFAMYGDLYSATKDIAHALARIDT